MNRDGLKAWIKTLPLDSYAYGATAVLFDTFDESLCPPPNAPERNAFCEGARDALLRFGGNARPSRLRHGEKVEVG